MYRKIDTKIWNDKKFRALSDDGRLLFFFILTHQSLNQVGAMRANAPGMAADLKWDLETKFSPALREVTRLDMVRFDAEAGLVWVPKFLAYNLPQSPNVVVSWTQIPDNLPECDLKVAVLKNAVDTLAGMSEGFQKALAIEFHEGAKKATTLTAVSSGAPAGEPVVSVAAEKEGATATVRPFVQPTSEAAPAAGDGAALASQSNVLTLDGGVMPKVVISLLSRDAGEIALMEAEVVQYILTYPGIDVERELTLMRAWLEANPEKRKTARRMRSFVTNWLTKEFRERRSGQTPQVQRSLLPPAAIGGSKNRQEALEKHGRDVVQQMCGGTDGLTVEGVAEEVPVRELKAVNG